MKFYDIQIGDIVIYHSRGDNRRAFYLVTSIVADEDGPKYQGGKSFYGLHAKSSGLRYITWAMAGDHMPEEFYEVWRDGVQLFPAPRVKL